MTACPKQSLPAVKAGVHTRCPPGGGTTTEAPRRNLQCPVTGVRFSSLPLTKVQVRAIREGWPLPLFGGIPYWSHICRSPCVSF